MYKTSKNMFIFLQNKKIMFYLSRVHLDACSTWTWSPIFIFFVKYVSNIKKYDISVLQVDL